MAQILVVDDEAAVRGALVAQLVQMGHRCTEASNGVAALEVLHGREVDLVLTDVAMPLMNGLQFLERALPYLEGRVPVVLLSSVDDCGVVAAALGAGALEFLSKPASLDEVRRVVESSLARRAETLRLHGVRRAPGGPVPTSALGAAPRDRREASIRQAPAGVPAFEDRKGAVMIPAPHEVDEQIAPPARSFFARIRHWIHRSAA